MLPSGAGYCSSSTEQQYSGGGGGVVTLQCMIAAERLLAATLVYMMLILAGDIETNPGRTLCESVSESLHAGYTVSIAMTANNQFTPQEILALAPNCTVKLFCCLNGPTKCCKMYKIFQTAESDVTSQFKVKS